MKKNRHLSILILLVGVTAACGQAPANGDAAKGKILFSRQCGLCHDPLSTDKRMAPGLKGLFKRPKLSTNGKPTTAANVLEKINVGGNNMPPFKDMLSETDKADLIAYLKTL